MFLFSLIGLPLTAGFAGKLLLFVGAFTAPADTADDAEPVPDPGGDRGGERGGRRRTTTCGCSGVMYLRTPLRPAPRLRAVPTFVAAVALAGGTLVFGVYPEPLARAARKAAPVPIAARADTR